jgi:hypothetical protein
MKYHPSLSRASVVAKGPAAIAMMVASEFGRASNRHAHQENVLACYNRARELMGVLETLRMPDSICRHLKPLFTRSTQKELLLPRRLHPELIRKSCAEMADAFNQAARQLSPTGKDA